MIEELLALADLKEYYEHGAEPWKKDVPRPAEKLTPENLSKTDDKANDNIRLLLRDRDRLYANQRILRRAFRVAMYCAGVVVLAAWTPLWLPMLLKLAGK